MLKGILNCSIGNTLNFDSNASGASGGASGTMCEKKHYKTSKVELKQIT